MTESAAGPTGPGTVVMELGADTGALILYTPPHMDGAEIEISRDGEPGARRTHSQVRQRQLPTMTKYAAVYPDLRAGQYTIWLDEHTAAAATTTTTTITGGHVTSCHWPA